MGKAETIRHRLIADAVLGVVFGPTCVACAAALDEPTRGCVCAGCWRLVKPLPPFIGDTASAHITRWRAAGEYEGPLRDIIHAFKYDERRSLARPLGVLMREAGRDVLAEAACVIPVPLHPWRHLRRGFNQSALLAGELDRPLVNALWRPRWTAAQAGLTKAGRGGNVERAFRLSPLLSRHRRERFLTGRIVVLVDDVRTTGATAGACAQVLLEAGAGEVRALVAASVAAAGGVRQPNAVSSPPDARPT